MRHLQQLRAPAPTLQNECGIRLLSISVFVSSPPASLRPRSALVVLMNENDRLRSGFKELLDWPRSTSK